jgi:DEAD/DEAH box helicase domain-containing protein
MLTTNGKHDLPCVYLDIETNELAAEVGGWGNIHLMTVGVAVTYDERDGTWRTWYKDDVARLLAYLVNAPMVVGYNLLRFDYKVLWGGLMRIEKIPIDLIPFASGITAKSVPEKWGEIIRTIDLMAWLKQTTGRLIGLDVAASSTIGKGKTEGVEAVLVPEMLRDGKLREVTQYCKDDVTLVRELFQWGIRKGTCWYIERGKPKATTAGWQDYFNNSAIVHGSKVKAKPRKRR